MTFVFTFDLEPMTLMLKLGLELYGQDICVLKMKFLATVIESRQTDNRQTDRQTHTHTHTCTSIDGFNYTLFFTKFEDNQIHNNHTNALFN